MPNFRHFIGRRLYLLEFLIRCFYNFVKVNYFELFVRLFILILNQFIDFPQSFPQTRIKVILYAIVCPEINYKVPPFETL